MVKYHRNIPYIRRLQYGFFLTIDHFLGRNLGFKITRPLRKKYYDKLYETVKKEPKGKVLEIDRVKNISPNDFQKNYLKKNIPLVFEGAAKNWGCNKWSLEFLKKEHGKDKILLVNQYEEDSPYEELTLGDLIDGINDGLARYYRFYPLIQKHPERQKDFDLNWLQRYRNKRATFDTFQVFIGPDDSYTPIHNANPANFFTQVYGEKEWVLIPNYYLPIIDPAPVKSNYRPAPHRKDYGPFNPFEPEYENPYHLYEYIDIYKLRLKPGDVLFVPPYWWHAVKNYGHSIGVGYRWLPLGFNFRHFPLYSFLDLCTIKPPFWKTWKLTKMDPNLTHMEEVGALKKYLEKKRLEKENKH